MRRHQGRAPLPVKKLEASRGGEALLPRWEFSISSSFMICCRAAGGDTTCDAGGAFLVHHLRRRMSFEQQRGRGAAAVACRESGA